MVIYNRFTSKLQMEYSVQSQKILRSTFVKEEGKTLVVQQGMERVLRSHWLWAVKSSYPIQNPLVLITTIISWQYFALATSATICPAVSHMKRKIDVAHCSLSEHNFYHCSWSDLVRKSSLHFSLWSFLELLHISLLGKEVMRVTQARRSTG